MSEIADLRSAPRFVLEPPLEGSFNGEPVRIFNIGEEGVQIESRQKMPRGAWGELRFSLPTSPRVLRIDVRTKWCRAAKSAGPAFSWPFRCGLEAEGVHALTLDSLSQLLELEMLRLDNDSLERKRAILQQKAADLDPVLPRAPERPSIGTLSSLVEAKRQAMFELTRNADLVPRLAEAGRQNLARETGEVATYEDEILAVWEYLHRCAPPRMIALAFDVDSGD